MAEKKEPHPLNERDFSMVILTLENVLIPVEKLSPTPSIIDGLDSETEKDLRVLGCELIQTSGILLKLPQVAMATGQVLFQRFYFSKSFVKHNMEVLAMACINLACKIEESPRRMRDVINVFHHIKLVKAGKTISPLILDQSYVNLKNQVIKAERRILKELGFCVHVKHPHKIIVMYLQVLECERNQGFVQMAWNYMNDSFRSDVFARYDPETIACACIYLAARKLQLLLPTDPPWFSVFCPHIKESDLQDICVTILQLYKRPKPNLDKLEAIVNEAKKFHIEAKLKAKGLASEGATPNSTSRPTTPIKGSPNSLHNSRKGKSEDERSDGSFGRDLNHTSKKRHHSRSRSKSRSRSRSKSRSYHSSSRSISKSPSPKRNKYRTPPRKYKKESRRVRDHINRYEKEAKRRVNKKRSPSYTHSRSRSISRSPERTKVKKYYKEKTKYRQRSVSHDRHKTKKHSSNGHSRDRSRSRDRYRR